MLDIVQRQGQAGEVWLKAAAKRPGLVARDICVSAVTPMAVRRELVRRLAQIKAGEPDPIFTHDDLLQMQRNAEKLFQDFAADNRIAPITDAVAERWGDLLEQTITYVDAQGRSSPIGSVQKLEIANAIVGRDHIPYTYIERLQTAHASLNGLRVEDPTTAAPAST